MRHVIYSIYIYAALCSHIWGPTPTPTHVHGFDLGVKRKPFIHRRCVTVVLGFKKRLATTVEISADESLGPMKSYSYVPFDSRFWMSWTANLYPKISKSSSTKDGFPQQKMLPHIAKTVLPVWPGYRQRLYSHGFFRLVSFDRFVGWHGCFSFMLSEKHIICAKYYWLVSSQLKCIKVVSILEPRIWWEWVLKIIAWCVWEVLVKIIVCYKHTKTITYNIYKSNHFHHIETLDLILACILGCCHFSTFCRFTLLIKLWQRYSGIFTHVSEITLFIPTHSIFQSIFSWLSLFDRPGETKHDLGGPEQRHQAPGGFPLHQWSSRRIDPQKKITLKLGASRFLLESTIKHSLKAHLYSSEFVLNPPFSDLHLDPRSLSSPWTVSH